MNLELFEARKISHLKETMNSSHQTRDLSGLDELHLFHDALPCLDFSDISLSSQDADNPFYISAMTSGHEGANLINETLAWGCQRKGWIFGIGSQRREMEAISKRNHHDPAIEFWQRFRKKFPDLAILSNLGITQLGETSTDAIQSFLDFLKPMALVIHLNSLQEALQPEGTPNFRNSVQRLEELIQTLNYPVILKETGCGFSHQALLKIKNLNLLALDISGMGGTHWGRIEGARNKASSMKNIAAQTFAKWGETTVDSVIEAKRILPTLPIWASGGVRSGLDAAKLLALGALRIGYAQPALRAALNGDQSLLDWMEQQEFELKLALFCTGSANPGELRSKEKSWKMKTLN